MLLTNTLKNGWLCTIKIQRSNIEVHLRIAPALIILGIINIFGALNAFANNVKEE